ncbi:hypothetical protein Q5H93_00015 [Hymenobacter sp. ASUV-10]|uniref:Uncharacterized protein n=1 Tax=Hymenobacter aranciens TaxID=3063996 RepID=A0ABT9B601_9BACT|nr:ABC-three component system middle component 6 [Hymenobacter sp. ASUV-10]MDO7873098.1 hypothetical protein [Hymenobacter sp. ASUV-10]
MILPSKHLPEDRALLTIGGQLLGLLARPKTISVLWEEFRARPTNTSPVSFDWFVLSLDLLASIGTITLDGNRIVRKAS